MPMPENFLVVVRCMTFNHHAYIEDAMNGFCIQKTNFPYLCIVMDDCSTDGEQEVIKNYVFEHFNSIADKETDDYVLNLCQHQINENCYFAVFYLKYNHYSIGKKHDKISYYSKWQDTCKYIALCEGDDYWIDKNKLQIQVDFLEENEEYGMCYTKVKRYVQGEKKFLGKDFGEKVNGFEDLLKNDSRIPTLVVCIRKTIYEDYMKDIKPPIHGWLMGDYPMWLYCMHETNVKFFDCVTGVYRILEESASHHTNIEKQILFIKSYFDIKTFFANKYDIKYQFNQPYSFSVFYVYIGYLRKKYDKEVAKKMRMAYRILSNRPLKMKVYYLCSYNYILWTILMVAKKLVSFFV